MSPVLNHALRVAVSVRRVGKDLSRLFGLVEITLEDVRPAREYLAVFGDLHFDAGQRAADGAYAIMIERVYGYDGRSLGQPVALQQRYSRAYEKERQVWRQRRAA